MRSKSKTNFVLLVAAVALFVSAALAQQSKTEAASDEKSGTSKQAVASAAPAVDPDYEIGVEDKLVINVWHEPEISRTVSVRPDGKISLPLIGEFEASGQTAKGLQVLLAKKLESVIKSPEVTVIVEEIHSQKFNILGEVGQPGSFSLVKPMTVLDAIALAGGLKDFANPKKMYILRRSKDGITTRIAVNYKELIKGSTSDKRFEIESRDTIVVP